ncbi:MAG: hypothetical protein ACU0B7_08045 [Paracoccaceae bacterium]|uniref:hypothetical protein n=1 Tax=Seohaeicola saemankumensis TaxID=481181 RepID=UPI001E53969A|nr:hypothetical protein [Seohaeicola saemankumensis]MCD1625223.1 hypothetical protein [Seohaeicola saemankumensis]
MSGCLAPTGGPSGTPALRQAVLADGAVVVRPPAGYCIDPNSLSNQSGGGFALIGSCASLTGDTSGVFVEPAIITLSVSLAEDGATSMDSAAFQTALGRGRILNAISRDDLNLLQVEGGARVPPSADKRHWRGLMPLNGHVLGLALYGAKDSAMVADQGMQLMITLAETIKRDSPAAGAVATPAANASE